MPDSLYTAHPVSMVDLHTHTTASDGSLTPPQLVQTALDRGLRVLGITDHDSTAGLAEAIAAADGTELEIFPGVEISTDVPRAEIHILGYFVSLDDESFQATLTALRDGREDRARRMMQKLADLGLPVEWRRVVEIAAGGAIGRPHVAQAMCEKGYVQSLAEAFDLYLGRNGPAYAERYKLTPVEAAQMIVAAGGLPVLAHPVIVGSQEDAEAMERAPRMPQHIEEELPQLVEAGLVGIEAYYPDYPPALTAFLDALAGRLGLVTTGGTDYHGPGLQSVELGSIFVPMEAAQRLRRLVRSRSR